MCRFSKLSYGELKLVIPLCVYMALKLVYIVPNGRQGCALCAGKWFNLSDLHYSWLKTMSINEKIAAFKK
jgi:hypothetical protein